MILREKESTVESTVGFHGILKQDIKFVHALEN
jgi:hypothetical protein